jgi:hypothetical protein
MVKEKKYIKLVNSNLRHVLIMFNNIGELCPKFKDLPNEAKFIWLLFFFTNEDISVLKLLGKYIIDCLDISGGAYIF